MLELYILNRHFNNRAISQVIAALLLIAIAVAAAILVYVFSIGLLGSLQGGGGQQVKQQLIVEAYNWIPIGAVTLTIRNVGTADLTVADAFVGGIKSIMSTGTPPCTVGSLPNSYAVPVQSSCVLIVTPPASPPPTITSGVAYVIKLVTADGAVFSYSAIAGQAS